MLLGTFYSGWVGDRFAVHYARRTKEIREPEHRLWLMVVSLLLLRVSERSTHPTSQNALSFAIGYGITPWLNMGYQNTFISAAFVGLAITMTFLIVGKELAYREQEATTKLSKDITAISDDLLYRQTYPLWWIPS
ncbi:hypothetical protein BU15DRAFT_83279 [Melanogaster broomeanus]|nr:hypothetical protein BU15DRAFT_83279 [Melanogaster broomeanus]